MKPNEAKKQLEKQYKRQNEYIKSTFDRISVILPKGTKEEIKALTNKSLNAFICDAVLEKIEKEKIK